jgi:hypothetical protein
MAEDKDFAVRMRIQAKERYYMKKEREENLTKKEIQEFRETHKLEKQKIAAEKRELKIKKSIESKTIKKELIEKRILIRAQVLEEMKKSDAIKTLEGEKRKGRPRIYPLIFPSPEN